MLKINNVTKIYQTKSKEKVTALDNVSLSLDVNELTFIVGQSGSGKTTLLNLLGGLDTPCQGEIIIEDLILGQDILLERYRQNYVGFVFQEYNLLENLTVYDNIAVAISSCSKKELAEKIGNVLEKVEFSGYEKRRINELSGGQKQRVAIARALAKNSDILLCDEPTGNLDSKTSNEIFDLLKKISLEKIVIIVSHNEELAKQYGDRLIRISDGKIISDENYSNRKTTEKFKSHTSNKVSLMYKVKLGFSNLFMHKFKTLTAFLLLLFSLLTMCAMQICINYNSERNIVNSLNEEKTVIVMQNNSTNGVSNSSERYPITTELSAYISPNLYMDGYRTIYGTIFISNNIVNEKEFYAKQDLSNFSAYITDYFIDIIINLNDEYDNLIYANYEDLLGKEVIYQGINLFKIAGVIKTDYKDFVDERGNQKEDKILSFDNSSAYTNTFKYKLNYEYNVIYTTVDTFNKMYIGTNSSNYNQKDGYQIHMSESNYQTTLTSINIYDSSIESLQYFDNSGYLKTTKQSNSAESVLFRELQNDEIIVNGELYNYIFGSNINWEEFRLDYQYGIDSGDHLKDRLSNLGKTVNILVKDSCGKTIIDVSNKKIIGVNSSIKYDVEDEPIYSVYGTKECFSIKNTDLADHYVSEIQWATLDNRQEVLEELRSNSIVIAGAQAMLIYEKEYIISQMSYFLIAISIILSILTIISTFNLVNTKIRDNKKEIGILMGIGFNNRNIIFIYLFSMICMTLFSFLMTLGIIYLSVHIVNTLLQTNPFANIIFFDVDILTYLTILLTGLVMIISSLIPLLTLSNKKPIDIIKKQ